MKKTSLLTWVKRGIIYCLGLFIMAIGVVFSVKSALGVSPVTCLANVTSQITGLEMGVCTTATYCLYILVEVVILRRDFKPHMLLQLVASFFFGTLVTLATHLFAFLPAPSHYLMRLVFLLISIPLVAFGVMLYLAPNILPTPGEGLSMAVSKKLGKPVASCKMITDCCMVGCSVIVSLIYFHGLVGVREGTVISALTVGFVMKRMMRVCQPWLLSFVERENKLERILSSAGYAVDSSGKPKLIISISREFGSDGYAIGQLLAKKLGVEFYDKQLVKMEAEESGLSESFIEAHEQEMSRGIVYDFLTASYAMYNEALSPMEMLFAAQTKIIRRIAAESESCVIVGRCSDYILYNDPNSFRIFIHAHPDYRTKNIAKRHGVSLAKAKSEIDKTDAARARHYENFTGREWGNTKYFNLAVDSGVFGAEGSVELIMSAIELWRAERERSWAEQHAE